MRRSTSHIELAKKIDEYVPATIPTSSVKVRQIGRAHV